LYRDGDLHDVPDPPAAQSHFNLGEILTDRRFLIVAVSYSLALACMTSLMVNVVSYWTDLGLSTSMATLAFALLAGVGMIGKPLFGWLADRYNARNGGMASFAFLLAGTVLLLWRSPWNTVPFVILFGLGIGGAVPMQSAINGALYGRDQFARIAGILTPWIVGVQASFYALTGYLHDRWHSYRPIFLLFAGLLTFSLFLLSRLRIASPQAAISPTET
jgi:MFS family permease